MGLVYVGIFFLGVFSSALAALHIPRKKVKWGSTSPRVKTLVMIGKQHDKL